MDVEEELTAKLAEEIENVIDHAISSQYAHIKQPELYTYLDRSKPYGQQRVWVRADVVDGKPENVECEEKDCVAHFGEWERWDSITKS